ncbi:MAG: sulfotransferase family 2 domain-containing protein [Pirellulaceae bacterium]
MNRVKNALRTIRDRASRRISEHGRRVCFAHVPKCGGTSIADALSSAYSVTDRALIPETNINLVASARVAEVFSRSMMEIREEVLAYALAQESSRLAMGHVPCKPRLVRAFSQEWRFVTVLRDPTTRFVSEYVYNTLKPVDWEKNNLGPLEYLQSEKARSAATWFLQYFSSFSPNSDADPIGYVEEAVENLRQFSVVGFLEDLDAFKRDFKSRVGIDLRIPMRNKTPSLTKKSAIIHDPAFMAEVRRLCEADTIVYRRARELVLGK